MSPWSVILIAILALAADRATRSAALAPMTEGASIPVFCGFNLTLGFNEGASFGILSGVMAGKPLAMAALTAAITMALAMMALRPRNPWEAAGFALAVGGSLGNILDRLRQGAVTDFLDVYWQEWHWPTLNVADVAITIGAGLMLIPALPALRKKDEYA